MKVHIKNINVWLNGLTRSTELYAWAKAALRLPMEYQVPKPGYYPKAQLRRLSPYNKIILDCFDMPEALNQQLPVVFASQHGDLAKTVELIKNVAIKEELSPTQFALSVHNATTGLFSIATNNHAATTTISAGRSTFINGLIEAILQVNLEGCDVIYAYADFPVPEEYSSFEQSMPAKCIVMILSNEDCANGKISIENNSNERDIESDASLTFIRNYFNPNNSFPICNKTHSIVIDKS